MGRVLQVRVSASTYNPDDVRKNWPRCHARAWPQGEPVFEPHQGVLQLIDALEDALRLADWDDYVRDLVSEPVAKLAAMKDELEEALAEWDPRRANRLTDDIEDLLSVLEKQFPKK